MESYLYELKHSLQAGQGRLLGCSDFRHHNQLIPGLKGRSESRDER